ncbi:MAG: 30S ribosomal protein S12 methylthiotransferase RimO [Clostridiales bacterium]|nr:30S ribosomal protein S12 methylthiotransferase RimO [Clostridiales bacterium]
MKKVFIDTYGCAKNEYDSQVLAASLVERGCVIVYDTRDADILILNTCGFIEDAKKESIDRIFELIGETDGGKKKLVVTGCLSQRYHKELAEEIPEVDFYFGVNDYDDLPSILLGETEDSDEKGEEGGSDRVGDSLDMLPYRKHIPVDDPWAASHYGYLKIAEGCYNACSFCAIPKIRGKFRSKKMEDCVREAEDLAANGVKELVLIAEDTSQYGRDLYGEIRLPELLHRLCAVDGIEWIRLMYVYDNGITDELIDTIASEPKICKYIDMPIQHISDNVLRNMRRRSNADSIKSVIRKLRERVPGVHIRTTLLVGSPGETQDDIDALLEFIDEYEIDRLGAFAYSDEEGTAAYDMEGKLPPEVCAERRDTVMARQMPVSERLNERKIGQTLEVMVDEIIEIDSEDIIRDFNTATDEELARMVTLYEGRTRYDAPEIDCSVTFTSHNSELIPGDIVNVLITGTYEYDLDGIEV